MPAPTERVPVNELELLFNNQVAPLLLATLRVPAPLEIKPLTVLSLVFDPDRDKELLVPDADRLISPPTIIVAFALPALFEMINGMPPAPVNRRGALIVKVSPVPVSPLLAVIVAPLLMVSALPFVAPIV